MKTLIKKALILNKKSPYHLQKKDVLIENEYIIQIDNHIEAKNIDQIIETEGLTISEGWIDMKVHARTPGDEHKEDFESLSKAAVKGGFTELVITSDSDPTNDQKAVTKLIKNESFNNLIDFHPIGSITKNRKGEQLTEMFDMQQNGAVLFGDDKGLENSFLMLNALLYSKNFNAIISSFPEDKALTKGGQMNEGVTSTKLGLKGKANFTESIRVNRDLYLANYANAPIHFSPITTTESIDLINEAKQKGQKVSAETHPYYLYLNDEILETFDSNYKFNPPLRAEKDRKELIKAIKNNTIEIISSNHSPENIENKALEFELAENGIIGLETFFSLCYSALNKDIELEHIIETFTSNVRDLLRLDSITIKEGEKANLSLFSTTLNSTYQKDDFASKSKNTPFDNIELKGKVIGAYNKGILHLN
jgi:dihydroorotase